jgi:hypothetical protein
MIQMQVYCGQSGPRAPTGEAAAPHAHREREKVLEEIFADSSLRVRCAGGEPDATWGGARDPAMAPECAELHVEVDDSALERALLRLTDRLAQAVRSQRIADFLLSLDDGTTIACPGGKAIQVSWPSRHSGGLAYYLAEQLGSRGARAR